jgi:hypothetical protein
MKFLIALLFLSHAAFVQPSEAFTPDQARRVAQEAVADILDALGRSDFKRLASHVGPEGLVVSPYVMLRDRNMRLSRAEVEHCGRDRRVRRWGELDGRGDPIERTCRRYFAEFVWDMDYRQADEVLYNEPRQRGLEPNNNHGGASQGIVVELHFREVDKPWRSWSSLRLIFRKGNQGLFLVAITRDVRTI